MSIAQVVYGGALVVLLASITKYYYAKKRHKRIEAPKYKMLDDDD